MIVSLTSCSGLYYSVDDNENNDYDNDDGDDDKLVLWYGWPTKDV